ncbi:sensor histidine kinase [Sphingomonas mucosissima]|uniref:histidine kinase n=1 Tax=Sphingomonas mucosissima TaxID=370959 RepID=A0A245ZME7_9SPHN|nr:PAS domain-containing protein [Sphingomonas mucosissima]OWK30917.1 blue-light-activated histidine kinase 1 [Sphingomonas mucosissima]
MTPSSPPILDETARERILALYDLAGARDDGVLDDLVSFAAELCAAPTALVSVVEEEAQVFLSRAGTDLEGTPRSQSFCAYAMHGQHMMEVPDAQQDARFADNPLVTEAPHIRFYAGAPLTTREGVPMGAICVLDGAPREGLTPFQTRGLEILATTAMARLEARRAAREQREQRRSAAQARAALADSEMRFRTLADTMPQMVWSTQPDGFHDYYNARWYEFTGAPAGTTDGVGWNNMFHPDDQDRAWQVWRHSLTTGEPYQIEYRLRHFDGTYRWVLGRALPIRDQAGEITRWFGTCTDIHEQKLALEEREVISQELSHRIKNIFAVIGGLIQIAARADPPLLPLAADLRERIAALGRAHDFVRPHSPNSRPTAHQDSLRGLLDELLAPYQSHPGERVTITGVDVPVDDRAATPLALLFHELATNASKYGALSTATGRVTIDISREGARSRILWREDGGPRVDPATKPAGFGSQLIELSAVRQLGGTVSRDWRPQGLELVLDLPNASFSRAHRSG